MSSSDRHMQPSHLWLPAAERHCLGYGVANWPKAYVLARDAHYLTLFLGLGQPPKHGLAVVPGVTEERKCSDLFQLQN